MFVTPDAWNLGHPPALWVGALLALAGAMFYMALLHVWYALRGIERKLHGAFAGLCLITALFTFLEATMYGATVVTTILWQAHRLFDLAAAYFLLLPHFMRAYGGLPIPRALAWSGNGMGALMLYRWVDPGALALRPDNPIEHLELPWGEALNIALYQDTRWLGLWYLLNFICLAAVLAYSRRIWLAGERRRGLVLAAVFGIFLGFIFLDLLRDLGLNPLPYVSELAAAGFLLLIGRELTLGQLEAVATRARMRRLSTEMALTEERERRRLAEAVHDAPVQRLAIALMQMEAAGEQVPCPEQSREHIREALRDLRATIVDLSPTVLYRVGLHAALAWLAEQVERRHGLCCRFHHAPPAPVLDERARVVLYQCARELVANAVKHAGACRIDLRMGMTGGVLEIRVEDDGHGFDPAIVRSPDGHSGFGLFSLHQRLEPLGGRLNIDSDANGTRTILAMNI